jgi:uncharacterized protein (DUF58 family)
MAIALAVGFAAINTNNNLLFFGWGLVLSTIVISGVLSEMTIGRVGAGQPMALAMRARATGEVRWPVTNGGRLPAFGVELQAQLRSVETAITSTTAVAFLLRMRRGEQVMESIAWHPQRRGIYHVERLVVATAAPFGFFRKERFITSWSPPAQLVVWPHAVVVDHLLPSIRQRLGQAPSHRAGDGDDFHALRDWREGDELKRLLWRKLAQSGRRVVREQEASSSRNIWLGIAASDDLDRNEQALATLAGLAEALLNAGHSVGVVAPGLRIAPLHAPRQREHILNALAAVDWKAPLPDTHMKPLIAVVAAGGQWSGQADMLVHAVEST